MNRSQKYSEAERIHCSRFCTWMIAAFRSHKRVEHTSAYGTHPHPVVVTLIHIGVSGSGDYLKGTEKVTARNNLQVIRIRNSKEAEYSQTVGICAACHTLLQGLRLGTEASRVDSYYLASTKPGCHRASAMN